MAVALKTSNWDVGRSSWYVRYGVAVSFVLLALLLQFLPPAHQIPFAFFFAAVALSRRICGFGAAIFSTFLSASMADFFLLRPRFFFVVVGYDALRSLFSVMWGLRITR